MRNALVVAVAGLLACGGEGGKDGAPGPAGPPGVDGVDGTNGADGADGQDGAPGAAGGGTQPVSKKYCSKVDLGFLFTYKTAVYSNGDRWVACSLADGGAEYSSSDIYLASQAGAGSGYCAVSYDADAGDGTGWFAFTDTASAAQVVYNDPGAPSDQATVAMAAGDCITAP